MILDNIDQLTPSQLAAGIYRILQAGNEEPETYERMKDRRLMPILTEIVRTTGHPPFAPADVTTNQADRVTMAAAYLLGGSAEANDQEPIQALIGLMDHENNRLKLAAAKALGEIGATEAEEKILAFIEQMRAQGEIGAVSKLTNALANIGGAKTKDSLERFVRENRDTQDKHVQHVVAEVEAAIKTIDERLA